MENLLNAVKELGNGPGSMKDRLDALRTEVNKLTNNEYEALVTRKPMIEKSLGWGVIAYKFIKVTCEFVSEIRGL